MRRLLFSIGLCTLITLSFIGCTKTDNSKDASTSQKSSVDTNQNSADKKSTSDSDQSQANTNSTIKDNNTNDNSNSSQNAQTIQKKQSVSKITFCENVDSNLNAINTSTRFTTGQIYARLQSNSAFNTSSIKITLLYIDGASETVLDTSMQDCNPAWSIYAFPVTTVLAGQYKVIVTDAETNTILGQGTFTVEEI